MTPTRGQDAVRTLSALLREDAGTPSTLDTREGRIDSRIDSEDWKVTGEARLLEVFRAARDEGRLTPAREHARAAAETERTSSVPRLAGILCRLRQPRAIAGALALGLAAAAAVMIALSPPPLSYVVDGKPARQSGRIVAPVDRSEAVKFSDGSELRLEPRSSLRVRETDQDGAMVIVESGEVASRIQHVAGTRWSIFAGPYEVKVIGTQFDTSWEPQSGRMSVVLHVGAVQILGAGIDNVVELKPGQRFDATAGSGAWAVQAHRNDQAPPTAQQEEVSDELVGDSVAREAMPPGSGHRETVHRDADAVSFAEHHGTQAEEAARPSSVAPTSGDTKKTWSKRVAEGDFSSVVAEAEALGLDRCLATCPSERLRAWADASRYTGKLHTAGQVLLRLREVSPQDAARAGYVLGSVSEAQGQSSAALRWYTGYLAEAPSGGFSAEARAGRMRALAALGREDAAKSAAREYLRRHPAGAGAKTARQLLDRP